MIFRTKRSGFTIIELLIVVAIIATIISIVLASLGLARAKARDTKRLSDIQQIQKSLEIYRADYGVYPPHDSGAMAASSLTELVPDYMSQIPLDPVEGDTGEGYRYSRGTSQTKYTLMVKFETDDHDSWCGISPGGSTSVGWSDTDYYRETTHPDCEF